MFSYSNNIEVLPTLTFTRAELVYALTHLLSNINDNDNSTRLEMVELRHYLNLVRNEVEAAARKRELSLGSIPCQRPDNGKDGMKGRQPDMAELKKKFPSLTEEEIRAVIAKARQEAEKEEADKRKDAPPPPPSFIAKSEVMLDSRPKAILTPKEEKDRENSREFANLLGGI